MAKECFKKEKENKCNAVVALEVQVNELDNKFTSKFVSIQQWQKNFFENIFPDIQKKLTESIKFVREAAMSAGNSMRFSESSNKASIEAQKSLSKGLLHGWLQTASIAVVFVGTVVGIIWKMNDINREINQKMIDQYKISVENDIKTQNKNQDRLEMELRSIKDTLIKLMLTKK